MLFDFFSSPERPTPELAVPVAAHAVGEASTTLPASPANDVLPEVAETDPAPPAAEEPPDPLPDETEASASTIAATETPSAVSELTEEPLADSASPADLASEESEASADTDEADRPDATPENEKPVAASKAATGEESLVDLPDFSHEPTEPGQYTLRIVFTFRPGNQSVLLSTQSHDVLAIVGELDPEGARALLAPFIAAHDARLSEIKQALTQSTAKVLARSTGARSNTAKKGSPASSTSTKTSAAKRDKPTRVVKPASPAPLPQTNLFND
ncbi:MAG: hypothetical protein JNL73_14190 [Anaerolineales bacterium]|nr:hypothetical protein [Anaerolineales bacterium]